MIVLGLIDSKPSAAALIRDGQIVAAAAEERYVRYKMADGMPDQSIREVLTIANVSMDEIDMVAVAQQAKMWIPQPQPWSGWFEEESKSSSKRLFDAVGSQLAPLAGQLPLAWKAHHQLKALMNRGRLSALRATLREHHQITAPVRFYDHHYCHAASAFYSSGREEALIITLDGGGDGRSGSVYIGRKGRLVAVGSIDSFNSLGNIYSYITHLCGFQAEKHEGKITGLAALGTPRYLDILRGFIHYVPPGKIRYRVPMYQRSAITALRDALPADFDHADLAASVQLLLEEIGTAFISYWVEKCGISTVVAAGGVFANVKFNQRVHQLPSVDSLFIFPAMDDSGLAVGGALAGYVDLKDHDIVPLTPQPLANVYFGNGYDNDAVEHAMQAANVTGESIKDMPSRIAELLVQGHVVARFTGRMEYGPRALGNRTILYQTTDPSVNKWLNERLKRTEFMPFAPATLAEHASKCYLGLTGARDAARFMTITFDCTNQMKMQSPGVVHVDGTARPQIVDATTAPDFHAILTEYHKLCGIPSLINTSFNMHGEPIVCSPADAIRSFLAGKLDYLAINDWLLRHPSLDPQSHAS